MKTLHELYQQCDPIPDLALYESGVEFVQSVFENGCSDLLFVRVDLSIREEFQGQTHAFLIREYFQRLCSNRRNKPSIFQYYVGMVWCLEWTVQKSYHYHCIFIFDGHNEQNGVQLGNDIGYYWVNNITDGKGTFWLSNNFEDDFPQCGIGRINYRDHQKRYYLLTRVISYLAKPDLLVRHAIQQDAIALGHPEWAYKFRTFGTSNVFPPRASNAGRPRVEQDSFKVLTGR